MGCQFHDKRLVNEFEDQLDKTIKTGYKETQKMTNHNVKREKHD